MRSRREAGWEGGVVRMRFVREEALWFEIRARERMKERKVRGVMKS